LTGQHPGNVNAGWVGWSQLVVEHHPVEAPVYGSVQGAHLFPAAQVDCSSDACAATPGRQVDRQRPSAVVPANATQEGGTPAPAVAMMESGTQNPSVQLAKSDRCPTGTMLAGRQWAPLQHPGKTTGLSTGGPFQGQVRWRGGCDGTSQPKLQAPVGASGLDAMGS